MRLSRRAFLRLSTATVAASALPKAVALASAEPFPGVVTASDLEAHLEARDQLRAGTRALVRRAMLSSNSVGPCVYPQATDILVCHYNVSAGRLERFRVPFGGDDLGELVMGDLVRSKGGNAAAHHDVHRGRTSVAVWAQDSNPDKLR